VKRRSFISSAAAGLGAATFGLPTAYVDAAQEFSLGNEWIFATWSTQNAALRMVRLDNRIARRSIPLPRELFTLTLSDKTTLKGSSFRVAAGPTVTSLIANPAAARAAERLPGRQITVELAHPDRRIRTTWRAILRDGSHYLRQEFTFSAVENDIALREVRLVDFTDLIDAEAAGTVDGSPIVSGDVYIALEHPLAQVDAFAGRANAVLPRGVPLRVGVPLVASNVIGVSAAGQMRRTFLDYIERERAHPYRSFLHYNSWYDIGFFTRYDQAQCMERIHTYGEQLHRRRGVALKSFLFDDGWDDPKNLWHFNSGFPDGFAPLKAAAANYGAAPGAWLSPWGGYGDPHTQRLESAKAQGYEINADGLALSGPKYYELFSSVVQSFIEKGGVNQFKLDGTGKSANVTPGSHFGSDFEAAIALIDGMRQLSPDVYVNLTTGTYPSPFWLRHCDSIWRGGSDHNFTGVGSERQRWITYRDADTYAGIVSQGPLYPLNSLMLHGLIYAQHAQHLDSDPHNDFRAEVQSYFATGTQLQEMYITPTLLSEQNWNDLARAANWSAANAAVLRDTHWIGGNPERLDVYGWASWTPHKAILSLRNPSDRAQEIAIDVARAFELPGGARHEYVARNVWEAGAHPIRLRPGRYHEFRLRPFEVLVLDALPVV